MKKINVMHLTNNIAKASSVESLILMLAKRIDPSKFSMSIVSLSEPECVSETFLKKANILTSQAHFIPWQKNSKPFFKSANQLVKLIKKYDVNVLHTHDVRTNLVGLIAARLTGIKVVASVHGWVMDSTSFLWKIYQHFDRWIVRFFDHIVVGSNFLGNDVIKLGVNSRKVTKIHNSIEVAQIDLSASQLNFREKYNLSEKDMVIGTVGRVSEEKGQKYFLEAAQIVIRNFPDVKFVIVGEGPVKNDLEQFVEEIGIADNIIFTGFYKNLSEVFSSLDLFVIPSLTESLPLVILEAMAAEKPIVSTNVGGIPESIIHEETGLLVRPKNSMEMAHSIIRMLNNKDLRLNLAANARQLVCDQFSIEGFVVQVETLYSDLEAVSLSSNLSRVCDE